MISLFTRNILNKHENVFISFITFRHILCKLATQSGFVNMVCHHVMVISLTCISCDMLYGVIYSINHKWGASDTSLNVKSMTCILQYSESMPSQTTIFWLLFQFYGFCCKFLFILRKLWYFERLSIEVSICFCRCHNTYIDDLTVLYLHA